MAGVADNDQKKSRKDSFGQMKMRLGTIKI